MNIDHTHACVRLYVCVRLHACVRLYVCVRYGCMCTIVFRCMCKIVCTRRLYVAARTYACVLMHLTVHMHMCVINRAHSPVQMYVIDNAQTRLQRCFSDMHVIDNTHSRLHIQVCSLLHVECHFSNLKTQLIV